MIYIYQVYIIKISTNDQNWSFLECKTLDFQLQADTNDQNWIFLECKT